MIGYLESATKSVCADVVSAIEGPDAADREATRMLEACFGGRQWDAPEPSDHPLAIYLWGYGIGVLVTGDVCDWVWSDLRGGDPAEVYPGLPSARRVYDVIAGWSQ